MEYRLINERKENLALLSQVLYNREIYDINHYLNVSEDDLYPPSLLNNIDKGYQLLKEQIAQNAKTLIIVDCDCDGFTSSAILLNYLHKIYPEWVENNVFFALHDGKSHGLSDLLDDAMQYDFVIIPDAGSNDFEEVKKLSEWDIKVLILDHHEADTPPEEAIIINPQMDDYPNKTLSGAGVVWKFCCYFDEQSGYCYAKSLMDLVAVGLIGDMIDLRDYETRYLINEGLSNIQNSFIQAMIEKNSYQLKGKLNPKGVSWYIAPLINAVNRVGSLAEKQLLFSSLLDWMADTEVESTKRGCKGEKELLVEQAIRTSSNVRTRQNKIRDNKFQEIMERIQSEGLDKNKMIIIKSDDDNAGIGGLIANQIVGSLHRPVAILKPVYYDNELYWEGSTRNADGYGVENLKDKLTSTGAINWASGHQSAFGLSIKDTQLKDFINKTNEMFSDIEFSKYYKVDAVINSINLDISELKSIAFADGIWGQGVEKPLFYFKDIIANGSNVFMTDKVLKIKINDELSVVKFFLKEEDKALFEDPDTRHTLNIIGSCDYNSYDSTLQIIIEDYEDATSWYF